MRYFTAPGNPPGSSVGAEVEVRDLAVYDQIAGALEVSMNAAQLERLRANLKRLRLFKSRERLEALLQEAAGKEIATLTSWIACFPKRSPPRPAKRHHGTPMARFPFVKGLEVFDFTYQPSLDRKQVQPFAPATSSSTGKPGGARPAGSGQDPSRRGTGDKGH